MEYHFNKFRYKTNQKQIRKMKRKTRTLVAQCLARPITFAADHKLFFNNNSWSQLKGNDLSVSHFLQLLIFFPSFATQTQSSR